MSDSFAIPRMWKRPWFWWNRSKHQPAQCAGRTSPLPSPSTSSVSPPSGPQDSPPPGGIDSTRSDAPAPVSIAPSNLEGPGLKVNLSLNDSFQIVEPSTPPVSGETQTDSPRAATTVRSNTNQLESNNSENTSSDLTGGPATEVESDQSENTSAESSGDTPAEAESSGDTSPEAESSGDAVVKSGPSSTIAVKQVDSAQARENVDRSDAVATQRAVRSLNLPASALQKQLSTAEVVKGLQQLKQQIQNFRGR